MGNILIKSYSIWYCKYKFHMETMYSSMPKRVEIDTLIPSASNASGPKLTEEEAQHRLRSPKAGTVRIAKTVLTYGNYFIQPTSSRRTSGNVQGPTLASPFLIHTMVGPPHMGSCPYIRAFFSALLKALQPFAWIANCRHLFKG